MPQYLPLPDGNSVTIQPGETPQQTWARALQMYPESFGGKAKEEQAPVSTAKGLIPAFKGAFQELKGQTALTAGKIGLTDEAQAQKYYEAQRAKGYTPTEEGWLEAPFLKTKELIGGSLPYVVAPVLAGLAAEAAPLTGLAALAAGIGAAAVPTYGQFIGSNLGRKVNEGQSLKEADLGSAALAAIPQTALDVLSLRMMPGLSKLLGVSETVAKNVAEQGLKKVALDYTMATGKAMGVEGLTESAQQVFERAQAGLSITDSEARKEYFDNFVGGAVLGGAIALPGRKFERMGMQSRYDEGVRQKGYAAAKLEFEKQQAEEAAKAQERAAALEEQKKPENLLKLHDDLVAAQQQVEEMKLARGKRPNAKTSDEDRKKYIEASQQIQGFVKDTINPLKKARSNFSELIDPLVEERAAELAKNAPPPAPPAPPTMGEAPPVVQQEEQQVPPPTPFAAPKTAFDTHYPTAVDLIKQSPEPIQNITPMWLSRQLNISPRTSKNILAVMENEGLLTPVEGKPGYFVDQNNPYVPPAKTVTPAAARVSPIMAAADTHYENALAQIKSGTITPTKAAVSKTFGVSDNAAREILDRMVEANILQYDPTTRKYTDPTRVKPAAPIAEETEVAPPAEFGVTPTAKTTKLAPPVIEPGETIAPAANPYVISQMGGIGKPFQVYGEAGPAPEDIAELERNATRTYIESLQAAGRPLPPELAARLEELNKPAPVPAAPVETPAPVAETPAPVAETPVVAETPAPAPVETPAAPAAETPAPETEFAVEEPEKPAKPPSIADAPAPFNTAVKPIKSDIPTLRDIERGWFHQTSPAGLTQLVNNDGDYHPAGLRVTDNSSFSAGQYDPKSVQIEFRPDSLSGAKQQPLPTGGGIYNTNIIAPQAIQSVSMTKAVEKKLPPKIKSALAQNFDLTTANKGEDLTYKRKQPVKQEAAPEPATEPKTEKPRFRKAEAPAVETPAPAETVEPATEPQAEVTEPVVQRKKRVVKPTAPAQAAVAEEPAEAATEPQGETPAPITTQEQKDKAQLVADDFGGTVAWQEGDLSLVRVYNRLSGQPIYIPARKAVYINGDVDAAYKKFGSTFTPQEIDRLRQIKKDLEAADAEKHATDPFIKHDANGLAFSENVPAEYRGIVEGWKKLLGLDARVYVSTVADARANKDNFTGPHRAISSAGLSSNERGSARYMSADDSYYITYTPSTSKTRELELIAHELGHVHEKNVFKNAPAETQAAIKADYDKWLASNKGKTAREHIEGLRAKTTGKTTEVTEGLQSSDLKAYWSSFSEWYADQVSRWSTTTDKPLTVVEKFFAKLAAAMRRFYTNVMQQKYLPVQSIQKFLDGIAKAGEKNGGIADVRSDNPFPESKVQKPVFHATQANFPADELRGGDIGIHFGDMFQAADRGGLAPENELADEVTARTAKGENVADIRNEIIERQQKAEGQLGNRRMLKFFINLKNPLRMDEPLGGQWHNPAELLPRLKSAGINTAFIEDAVYSWERTAQNVVSGLNITGRQRALLDEMVRLVQDSGYDGIVYKNKYEGRSFERIFGVKGSPDSYIVFSKDQVSEPIYDVNYSLGRAEASLSSIGPYDNLSEKPTPSIQTKRILNKLSRDYTKGLITEAEYVARVEKLNEDLAQATEAKKEKEGDKDFARGVNRVRQRLSEAAAAEEIDQGAVEFALWLLQNNPHLANDLAISIKTPKEEDIGTRGTYLPFDRLITLFKNKVSDTTAVHEILHHAERMMPFKVQQEIRKEHAKAYAKELVRVAKARDEAIKTAIKNGEITKEYADALLEHSASADLEGLFDYLVKNDAPDSIVEPVVLLKAVEQMAAAREGNRKAANEVETAFGSGILDVDTHYPLTNPSEFWAVNASDILQYRYLAKSWQERARNWLRELLEKAKGFFGLRSESPLYKGLDSVMRGDGTFTAKKMLLQTKERFREIAAPAPSFVESKPTLGSQFKTALTDTYSVAARQKLIDQYASTDFVVKEGQARGLVSDVQAGNMQYAIRYGQQHNQYAGLALTHGPLTLQKQKTPNGVQFTYESKPGPNMMQAAKELEASGLDKKVLEDYFTTMISGQRAMSPGIGWEKLNLENPAQAAQRYKEVMAIINASPQAKAAFAKASDTYRKFNHGLIDFARDCGYFTDTVADELKSRPFIPFYRVEKDGSLYMDLDKVSRPVRLGNIKNQPRLIELVGGTEKIKPIFESAAQNAFLLTNLSLGNKARQEVAATLKQVGVVSRIAGGKGPGSTNTLQFRINGKDTYAVIDEDTFGIPASLIVQGLEGVTTMVPLAYRIMGIPANLLRKFVTRFPAYALRQALRDPLNAFVTSGANGIPILNSLKQAGKMVAGRGQTAKELLEAGAIGNAVFTGDQRDAVRLLEQISTGRSGWTKAMAKLDAFAMAGDALTRASIYEDSISKGFTKQEALLRTLESQNFTRRGTSASLQNAGMMIPFLNAQIQGLDVLYRASGPTPFSKHYRMPFEERVRIRKKFYQRAAMLAGSTAIYTVLMMDDDRYKRAKPEERYGNWFIVNPLDPEGDLIRVPIPFEVGILFKAIPEALINVAFGDETADNALKGMGKLLEQSNPFSFPTFIKPAAEVVLNRSFFGGDIESTRELKLEKAERVRPGTTGTAALLGQAGLLSPVQIDHLIRGYTGSAGIFLADTVGLLFPTKYDNVERPTKEMHELPLIGSMFQNARGRGIVDEAYDRMAEVQRVSETYKLMISEGRREEAQAYLNDHLDEAKQIRVSGQVEKYLGELAKQKRQVMSSPKLTTEQKDVLLKRIDDAQDKMAKRLLTAS
jgi:hypothetical protein